MRDAAYAVLTARLAQPGEHGYGDEADRRFLQALDAFDPPEQAATYAWAGLEDMGRDIGRHVYAKSIVEDDFPHAVDHLAEAIEASGFGRLVVADVFHRTAKVNFQPSPGAASIRPEALEAYLDGVLAGALATGFNAEVQLAHGDANALEIALASGRDVNEEVQARG
ncbi:MAG: hypothetical protein R3185_05945 [Candidatus Thermoplasmatota archaeon]|nr:hypothetical protein [Candidatus Thermoplasmatota archaeon]